MWKELLRKVNLVREDVTGRALTDCFKSLNSYVGSREQRKLCDEF